MNEIKGFPLTEVRYGLAIGLRQEGDCPQTAFNVVHLTWGGA